MDIQEIIIRYLDGSATLEEKIVLLNWLKQSEQNRDDFSSTRDLWLYSGTVSDNELEVDIALNRLKDRIIKNYKPQKQNRIIPIWLRVAAAVLVLVCSSFLGGYYIHNNNIPLMQNQLITASGSKGRFELPDGSIVWLNGDSKLLFPEKFSSNNRKVTLEGGAYFEIKKNTKRPFIVKTQDFDVEVLGTHFAVSSYASQDVFETALLTGSVKISNNKDDKEAVILKPDQLFEYDKISGKIKVEKVRAELYANWINKTLTFDNEKIEDILVSMEGWYNVRFECSPKIRNTRISLTVRQENLDEILSAISNIIPWKYQKKGNIIIIESK